MSINDKMQVFPSRANQVLMKQRIQAAKRGIGLLKRKRDAIDMKLRDIRAQMSDKEEHVDEAMRTAIFSVAKANLLGTDFKPLIVADSKVATTYLRKRQLKVVGVTMNYFDLEMNGQDAFPLAGLSCGGQQVQRVRQFFQDALKEIVEYASLEYMLRMLTLASRQTNMRVNALDYVVIPRLASTLNYIVGELEEYEREDFYRLKRSQAKQLEAKIAFTELIKTRNMTAEELAAYLKRGAHLHPVADVTFDSDAFEYESLEDRLRKAHVEHASKRRSASHHSDIKPSTSTVQFLKMVAVQRNINASKASFISLIGRTLNPDPGAFSDSSVEPNNDEE